MERKRLNPPKEAPVFGARGGAAKRRADPGRELRLPDKASTQLTKSYKDLAALKEAKAAADAARYDKRKAQREQFELIRNRKGRPKGQQDKATIVLTELIKMAAEMHGADGKGLGGLLGYLTMIAGKYPKIFTTALLARLIPMEIRGSDQHPIRVFQLDAAQLDGLTEPQLAVLEQVFGAGLRKAPTASPDAFAKLVDVTPNKEGTG